MKEKKFTGWFDKNGVKVFEGDRMVSDRQPGEVTIVWNNDLGKFETDDPEINARFSPRMVQLHGIVKKG